MAEAPGGEGGGGGAEIFSLYGTVGVDLSDAVAGLDKLRAEAQATAQAVAQSSQRPQAAFDALDAAVQQSSGTFRNAASVVRALVKHTPT